MPSGELVGGGIGAAATALASWFAYLGVRRQSAGAKEASSQASAQRSQDRALQAWEALLQPHIEDLRRCREDLNRAQEKDRARDIHDRRVDVELRQLRRRTTQLERENDRLLGIARTIARWAVRLRDQLVELGVTPAAAPGELETLQALDDAEIGRRPGVASEDDPADPPPAT